MRHPRGSAALVAGLLLVLAACLGLAASACGGGSSGNGDGADGRVAGDGAVPDGGADAAAPDGAPPDGAQTDAAPIPSCGDDVTAAGEACDGLDLNGHTCASVAAGFTAGGTLACRPDCRAYDVSGCVRGNVVTAASC